MTMRNTHLSYSRLSRFETCALSYRLHYLDRKTATPGLSLRFGKLLHSVLERLLKEAVAEEYVGRLPLDRATQYFREEWNREQLRGFDTFEAGLRIVRDFVAEEGVVDHRRILALEQEFRLPVGPYVVLGYIDRIDVVDDETISVLDYKSNFQLFSKDDVESSLQLSLYEVAARRIWPWARNVQLGFRMLRHGITQRTSRTPEQLENALSYVETLGHQMETADEFPPSLNPNCNYCDHRDQCGAYAAALEGKRDFIAQDLTDLESVAREREEVARKAKILYARQKELDGVLKAHLKEQDELRLAGTRYRIFNATTLEYPLAETVDVLARAAELPREELEQRLAAVDKHALEAVLKDIARSLDKPRLALVKAELEAHATKSFTPRIWAKEIE